MNDLHSSRDDKVLREHLGRRHPIVEELHEAVARRAVSIHVVQELRRGLHQLPDDPVQENTGDHSYIC